MPDFKKLRVWKESRILAVDTVRAVEDITGSAGIQIRNQVIRSVMSIPSNIAEGSRKGSDREFARYIRIALGSAAETESHLILASDLKLIDEETHAGLCSQIETVQQMLSGLTNRLSSDD